MRWTVALGLGLLAGLASAQEPVALKSQKEKLSYALGMDIGNTLRKQAVEVDQGVFSAGLKDALAGGKTLLNEHEVRTALAELQSQQRRELKRRQVAGGQRAKEAAERSLTDGGAPARPSP